MLRGAFRRAFWNAYDHLGLLVVANLCWIALSIPIVTAPAATVALVHLGRKIAQREEVSLRDFFRGFRLHAAPATKAGAVALAVGLLIWMNIDFYSHLASWAAWPGMILAGVMVWVAAFVVLMYVHILPLIAWGERRLPTLLRKSALLTLDNLPFTIGAAAQALAVAVLCAVTGAGLVIGVASFPAVLLATAHRELLKKYFPDSEDALEPPELRGFREFVRPWEYRKPRG
jgi:uncharacterized membrane protein YesL